MILAFKKNIFIKTLLFFLLVSTHYTLNAQTSENDYYERLFYTCKFWGHVKYYHTEIAKGNVDWDEVLINSLEAVKNAPTNEAFNAVLMDMLNQAGEMDKAVGNRQAIPDSLNNNTDLTWIDNTIFSDSVSASLSEIWDNFLPRSHVYVNQNPASNPGFDNDNGLYESAHYPSEQVRILALFRYWNIINYFFPYKYIMDQDWDTSLIEFIPSIVDAEDALAYNLAFKELTTRLNDTHTYFYSPIFQSWVGGSYPPFRVRWIEEKMVVTKVLSNIPELNLGDVITTFDGIEINTLRDSLRKYAHGSNPVVLERELNELIMRGTSGTFTFTVQANGSTREITSVRSNQNFQLLREDNSPIWQVTTKVNGCRFGVVDMGRLEREDVNTMFDELWDTDVIVFDIRNYPRGTLWTIVPYLFKNELHIANFTVPDRTYAGRLFWQEEKLRGGVLETYAGNVIILFDERTQSQAEYTCMGLEQFPGAIKIGSTTSAADGNISRIYLPGNINTMATFLGTYYPDYSPTQRIGILPDYEVKPTIAGIQQGIDEVMEFALNCDITNTNNNPTNKTVFFYPNPVNDFIFYESSVENISLIEVFDVLGRQCVRIEGDFSSNTIDVSNLAQGTYSIKFHTASGETNKRFVKL